AGLKPSKIFYGRRSCNLLILWSEYIHKDAGHPPFIRDVGWPAIGRHCAARTSSQAVVEPAGTIQCAVNVADAGELSRLVDLHSALRASGAYFRSHHRTWQQRMRPKLVRLKQKDSSCHISFEDVPPNLGSSGRSFFATPPSTIRRESAVGYGSAS